MPPTNPLPPPAVANTVPAMYTNIATFTYINGLFRVTFFEQNLTSDAGAASVVTESTVPRTAVIMTPATFADFLRIGGELYNRVAAAARACGGMEVSEGSDTLQ